MFNIHVLQANFGALLGGAMLTLLLSLATVFFSILVGACLCAVRMASRGSVRWVVAGVIDFFRTIPEPIPIVWLYACAPFIFNFSLDAVTAGVTALSLIYGAYFAEIFRGGILSVPRGEIDAGKALGLSPRVIFRFIMLPPMMRVIVAPSVNVLADIIKGTSLLSLIGVTELAFQAGAISARTFRYLELYTGAGLLYFLAITLVSRGARVLENRFGTVRLP